MKKMILKLALAGIFMIAIAVNLSIHEKTDNVDVTLSLKNIETFACNIIPEEPEDYCWDIEYFPEYYTCTEGGIWSCYV